MKLYTLTISEHDTTEISREDYTEDITYIVSTVVRTYFNLDCLNWDLIKLSRWDKVLPKSSFVIEDNMFDDFDEYSIYSNSTRTTYTIHRSTSK